MIGFAWPASITAATSTTAIATADSWLMSGAATITRNQKKGKLNEGKFILEKEQECNILKSEA